MKVKKKSLRLVVSVLGLVGVFTIISFLGLFQIGSNQAIAGEICRSCTKTSWAAFKASRHESKDDFWIAIGNCNNLSDPDERRECRQEAKEELFSAKEDRRDQLDARLEICEELGEGPYDPVINPDDFVDFEEIVEGEETLAPNRYFPLVPGTTWEYLAIDDSGTAVERILVEVLDDTKEILGVNCIIVRDRVWEIDEEGEEDLIEDTDDWYAQDMDGNVWYFGEISKEFEDGELVGIEGSWTSGVDGAKPGYLMLADPEEGDYYRQEFFLGDAEDMGEVISIDAGPVAVPFGIYTDDVLKTRDWTPIEPDVLEYKYYAPDVGMVLEFDPDSGERVELINMTTP